MTGIKRIEDTFKANDDIKLMTHVVGGYPDIDTCEKTLLTMAENGVDFIEIQLPFSDPMADGPIILKANHHALDNGVTTHDVLDMVERVRAKIDIPLLIMSYINPIFTYGVEEFVKKILSIGIDGVIIPDCPLEEPDVPFQKLCNEYKIAYVPLIAPSTTKERMKKLAEESLSPFVYTVLRLGVTGRKTEFDEATISYLNDVKNMTGKFIASGFGIREKKQINTLKEYANCGIIGSALLSEVTASFEKGKDSVVAVEKFLNKLR